MNTGKDKFLKICREQGFFDKHHKLLLALSGGQDSMTLFNWLYDLQNQLQIEFVCAHINYGLRVEADEEERQLRQLSQEKNISLYVRHFSGKFTEQLGRDFRYQFFREVMAETGASALLTAHHKDDQVETVLMREITGRRLRHLSGIPSRQPFAGGELIRPLLAFEKAELDAAWHFEDSTNQGTDYLRNRIRNVLIPQLKKENPRFVEAFSGLTDEIKMAFTFIGEEIGNKPILFGNQINLKLFQNQSSACQYFALQAYLEQFSELQISKRQFDELLVILNREQQYEGRLTKDYYLIKTADKVAIKSAAERQEKEKNLEVCTENPNDASFLAVYVPENLPYEIRSRRSTDHLQFHGVHRKLKQFFIDKKMPLEERSSPLVAVGSEIYAVPALGLLSDLSKSLKNVTIKKIIWVRLS